MVKSGQPLQEQRNKAGYYDQKKFQKFFPNFLYRDLLVWLIALNVLALLSVIYLVQSVRKGVPEPEAAETVDETRRGGIAGFFAYWRNVFWCFALFLAYLLTMPYLGMLIGGLLFVFMLLNALGGWQPRQLVLHAVIALVTVGGMWSLFTFGLHVLLPPGEILGRF